MYWIKLQDIDDQVRCKNNPLVYFSTTLRDVILDKELFFYGNWYTHKIILYDDWYGEVVRELHCEITVSYLKFIGADFYTIRDKIFEECIR
jgi:hypothetical protein